ncbi:hypothetical protein [Parvibaculum sp.]|uniref:hypothetical protein n=2 Tax=Alphaproteobacteria TaxID=28211 RepID=UPI00329A1B05
MILPLLPDVSVERAPPNPPEFMFASAWYYLPKSADILFQQILVAAVVLGAARAKIGLGVISVGMAALFDGVHLLLILDEFTPLYVARFTIAATIFGFAIPYSLLSHTLRVPKGLRASLVVLRGRCRHHASVARRAAMGKLSRSARSPFLTIPDRGTLKADIGEAAAK